MSAHMTYEDRTKEKLLSYSFVPKPDFANTSFADKLEDKIRK